MSCYIVYYATSEDPIFNGQFSVPCWYIMLLFSAIVVAISVIVTCYTQRYKCFVFLIAYRHCTIKTLT